MTQTEITVTTKIDLDTKVAGQWFSGLSDELQADFFIAAAEASKEWRCQGSWSYQFFLVGRHLRDCSCSTERARVLVREIALGLEADS